MHESEVKPPPGGSEVRASVHPGICLAGAGTVVGVAEGGALVVGAGAVVVDALVDGVDRW
jgi:hypothetical protein